MKNAVTEKDAPSESELMLFPREGKALDESHVKLLRTTLAIFDVEVQLRADGTIMIIHEEPLILEQIGDLIHSFSKGRCNPLKVKRSPLKDHPDSAHREEKAIKFKQVQEMAELLRETTGSVPALITLIPQSITSLGLSSIEVIAFCKAAPKGEELWLKYAKCRNSSDASRDYCFSSFMVEVLADTDCPVLQ